MVFGDLGDFGLFLFLCIFMCSSMAVTTVDSGSKALEFLGYDPGNNQVGFDLDFMIWVYRVFPFWVFGFAFNLWWGSCLFHFFEVLLWGFLSGSGCESCYY